MEIKMSNKTITHEVKLQKSVIVILAIMAFGISAHIFVPAFTVKQALADYLSGDINVSLSGGVSLY
jgi:hypothetical protein|tara:strand:- start:140 stop:337 length:198 start_codon:yes stop_codon:yes gene_type:complete